MDASTIITVLEMSHRRLLDELASIENSGQGAKALAWRPGPGRVHLGWQFMHCASAQEKFLKVWFLDEKADEQMLKDFASNSTASDAKVPSLSAIRAALDSKYAALKSWLEAQPPETLMRLVPARVTKQRTVADAILHLAWHEAQHHGQIHLTWNLYKAANGIE